MLKIFVKVFSFVFLFGLLSIPLAIPKRASAGCIIDPAYYGGAWPICPGSYSQIGCGVDYTKGQYTYYNRYTNSGTFCGDGSPRLEWTKFRCDGGTNPCAGPSSFTPETKIDTPDGEKEIKDLRDGDKIKSFDIETGKITESTVRNMYTVTRDHIYEVTTTDGTVIKATGEHPFYTGKPEDQLPKTLSQKIKNVFVKFKIYLASGIHVLKLRVRT